MTTFVGSSTTSTGRAWTTMAPSPIVSGGDATWSRRPPPCSRSSSRPWVPPAWSRSAPRTVIPPCGWPTPFVARMAGSSASTSTPAVQRQATSNLGLASLSPWVELRCADGGQVLAELPDASQDVVFLDSERPEYPGWWPHPVRVLRPGGLLAVDNVLSHPDEVAPFVRLVVDDPALASTVVAVGKGELLAVKARP